MSEIRINITDREQTISGTMHGSFGDILTASLAAEPETFEELETALRRFIKRESDWFFFRSFRRGENFEPYDAGLLMIDLTAKLIMADSTYSYYSTEGTVLIETLEGEDFHLPYKLPDDWTQISSLPEFEFRQSKTRAEIRENPPLETREILFGKPLFEFIAAQYAARKEAANEDLFTEIHADWLMTERNDLNGKTPREILFEKREFIDADLSSRALQWSLTGRCPPPVTAGSRAFRYAGFGTHTIVVYYDLFRHLLMECFERKIENAAEVKRIADYWLNQPQSDYSGRTPARIIESERQRENLTMSAHECLIDEDCEICQMTAAEFDTPMFWHLDGSQMEYDRFEFSFDKTRAEWEAEQRRYEQFNRDFEAGKDNRTNFFDDDEIIL